MSTATSIEQWSVAILDLRKEIKVKLLRNRRRVTTMVVMSALVMMGITPVAMAEATAQFSLSVSSGRPGLLVELQDVDPCPPTTGFQHVYVTFTDAAGVLTYSSYPMLTEPDGSWYSPSRFYIPFTEIPVYGPRVPTAQAASGVGTFRVECVDGNGSGGVTRTYEPRTFNVTGPSMRFVMSSTTAQRGDMVRIRSMDSCPTVDSTIRGTVHGEVGLEFSSVTDPADGSWSVELSIPHRHTNNMGDEIDLPHGTYVVSAYCATTNEWLADANYGMETLVIGEPSVRYVALGDSYSSGEGTFNYFDTQNSCHRSSDSYVSYLADTFSLGQPLFAACSGAVTDDFYVANPANPNEPSQLSRLSHTNEVVTLTLGGNDAGFREVLERCVHHPLNVGWGCSQDQTLRSDVEHQIAALAGTVSGTIGGRPVRPLFDVYRAINSGAIGARIYVAGYPRLFGTSPGSYAQATSAPSGYACFLPTLASVDYQDAQWLNRQADALNAVIRDQVQAARQWGIPITYVSPALFTNHGLCDQAEPWVNGVIVDGQNNPRSESFHPTVAGYRYGYGNAFRQMMQ